VEWKAEFSVGIAEIDEQHRTIVDCIALLQDAVTARERWSAVNAALTRLADYVRIHFAVEESLMRIMGYPELARHAEEHNHFAAALRTAREESLRRDVSDETLALIHTWLRNHIAGSDKSYAAYFREVVTPPSPGTVARIANWWDRHLMPRHHG
jgi:hemerythrin